MGFSFNSDSPCKIQVLIHEQFHYKGLDKLEKLNPFPLDVKDGKLYFPNGTSNKGFISYLSFPSGKIAG